MVEPPHHFANDLFHLHEVHKQANRVELRPFHGHAHPVIVTMRILALAFVAAQGMPGGKRLFHAHLKHFAPNCAACFPLNSAWSFSKNCASARGS